MTLLTDTTAGTAAFRGRRLRRTPALRALVRETRLDPAMLVAPLFVRRPTAAPEPVAMWALCGPGDEGEPVITVMLKGED